MWFIIKQNGQLNSLVFMFVMNIGVMNVTVGNFMMKVLVGVFLTRSDAFMEVIMMFIIMGVLMQMIDFMVGMFMVVMFIN